MRAHARLAAEYDAATGRTVLRELRSMAPLTLFPRRGGADAHVYLVNAATTPLGGDELALTVHVGPGATVRLSGVAATLALPGPHGEASSATFDIEIGEGGCLDYLPEPTVVTARARHAATLRAALAADARFRAREMLVLGRAGERPGHLTTSTRVTRAGTALLHQDLTLGDPALDASAAYLAGRRVLATEVLVGGDDPVEAVSGDWWALTPLAGGGALATALAGDAVTTTRDLDRARAHHPGWPPV